MKSLKLWLWACTVALIAGCGGASAEVVDEGEALLSSSEACNRPASDVAGGIAEVAVVVDPGRNVEAG